MTNLGNTCYINAVVQACAACGEAAHYVASTTEPAATELRHQTQQLFQSIHTTGAGGGTAASRGLVVSPRNFWRAVRTAIPEYNNSRQQDGAEFFNMWQQELSRVPGTTEPSAAWARWLAERDLHTVTYTSCNHCRAVVDNQPAADQKALDPTRVVMADVGRGAAMAGVSEAVRKAFGPVALEDRRCDPQHGGCGKVGGQKVMKCRTLPRVLVVCLARYRQGGRGPERVSTPVRRVADDVDFAEHLDALSAEAGGDPATLGHRTNEPAGTRYRPRAVVCHEGATPREGHYTCWVRSAPGPGEPGADTWVRYDDSVVSPPQPTLPPEVATGAYLVFYELMPRAADGGPEERSANKDHDTENPTHAPVIVVDPPPGAPAEIADRSDANAPSGPAPATSGDEGDDAGSGRDGSDGGEVEGDDPMETD